MKSYKFPLFSVIRSSFLMLSGKDKKRVLIATTAQSLISILDLIGVILAGLLATVAVRGIQSTTPTQSAQDFLNFLHIEEYSFQIQTAIMGCSAASILLARTILSAIVTKKLLKFLELKSSNFCNEFLENVQNQTLVSFGNRTSLELLYLVTTGTQSLVVGVLGAASVAIADSILVLALFSALFILDPYMAMITLSIFALIAIQTFRVMKNSLTRKSENRAILTIQSNEKILEYFSHFREILVRNAQSQFLRRISVDRSELSQVNAELNFMPYVSKYVIEATFIFFILILASFQFVLNDATNAIGKLAVFMLAGGRLAPAILRAQQGFIQVRTSAGPAEGFLRLQSELKQNEIYKKQEPKNPKILDFQNATFTPQLSMKNVEFSYSKDSRQVINNLNLEVQVGQQVAIAGKSGSGKSTLVDLIIGAQIPDEGEIMIGGLSPRDAVKQWPGMISYVPQETKILNGNLLENILFGLEINSESILDVKRILSKVQLDDFVDNLENGLYSNLGEFGSKLSGGQKQRIGIARALITQPKLLILDEATSSLDGETEFEISSMLRQIDIDLTMIVIAHRLSTVKNIEKVVYLSEGKIKASGTFDEVRKAIPDFDSQASLMGL